MLMLRRAQNILMWGLFAVVIGVLIAQAYNPAWRGHLQVDVVYDYQQAVSFWEHTSWAGIPNAYQPGALWYFVLLGALTPPPITFDAFLTTTILINLLLMGAHVYFFWRFGHKYSAWICLAFLVTTGPLLLYRFELIVSLLVLISWYYFGRFRYIHAAFLLGLASAIKLYPVVLFPLLLCEVIRRKRWQLLPVVVLFFMLGVGVPVMASLIWGGTLTDIVAGLNFHQLKPVGLEGVWGSVIIVGQQLAGIPLRITPGYGVHGFTPNIPGFTLGLLNSIWIVPFGLALVSILWSFRRQGYTNPALAFILLLIFVVFAKVLNPQYLWWFISFLPLVPLAWLKRYEWWLAITVSAGSLIVTQVIYPLRYTEFLDWFYQTNPDPTLFYISIIRNLLLAALPLLFLYRSKPV